MTQNQIAYWSLQETKRSNLVKEGQGQQNINETIRSNKAKESETHRSNVAREQETNRSNLVNEQLKSDLQEAQKNRWNYQNGVDTSNAVTGGIGNLFKGLGSLLH